jgi:hypothetical protein
MRAWAMRLLGGSRPLLMIQCSSSVRQKISPEPRESEAKRATERDRETERETEREREREGETGGGSDQRLHRNRS